MYLRQSTASQTRLTPRFVDSTDFATPETGLTIANTDVKLSKNGAASANKNSGGGTHIEGGRYALTFDATDTATVGELAVGINVAGALPVEFKYFVVEEAVYDALFAASAPGYLQPTTAGRTLDVSAGGEAGIDWANIGSPTTAVNLSATNIDVDQVVASVSGAVASVTGAVGSVTGNVGGNVTGSVGSVATGGITAASFAADAITAAKVAADVGTEIGTAVWATAARTLTANTNLNDLSAAGVRAAVGLASANLDTQIATLATATALDTVDNLIDTVKVKTDSLTFTTAGMVDAAIKRVGDTTLAAAGTGGQGYGAA